MNIRSYHFFIISITIVCFTSSCCVIPEFVQQECIKCDIKSSSISDIACEVALLENGRKTRPVDIFLSYYADTLITIDTDNWAVLHNESKCKIKKMQMVKNNKWQKVEKKELYGRVLLLFTFSEEIQYGDTIQLFETSQITNKERLRVTVVIPKEIKASGIYDNNSRIKGLLPKVSGFTSNLSP